MALPKVRLRSVLATIVFVAMALAVGMLAVRMRQLEDELRTAKSALSYQVAFTENGRRAAATVSKLQWRLVGDQIELLHISVTANADFSADPKLTTFRTQLLEAISRLRSSIQHYQSAYVQALAQQDTTDRSQPNLAVSTQP